MKKNIIIIVLFLTVGAVFVLTQTNLINMDKEAPVITINGDGIVNVEMGSSYIDRGAVGTDNVDEVVYVYTVISFQGEEIDAVDCNEPGVYTYSYSAVDEAGNQSKPAVRRVYVEDTTSPTIYIDREIDSNNIVISSNEGIYAYSLDNGDKWFSVEGNTTYTIEILESDDYQVVVKDFYGNISTNWDLSIDINENLITSTKHINSDTYLMKASKLFKSYSIDNGDNWVLLDELTDEVEITGLIEGEYEIVLQDNIGNTSSTFTLTVDTKIPEIASFSAINVDTYTLVSDDRFNYYSIDGVWYELEEPAYTHVLTDLVDLGTIYIRVKDLAGNVSNTLELEIDNVNPLVISDAYYSDEAYTLIMNENIINYSVDGVKTILDFSQNAVFLNDLEEGEYHIYVTDEAGNVSDLFTLTRDITKPMFDESMENVVNSQEFTIMINEEIESYSIDDGETFVSFTEALDTQIITLGLDGVYNLIVKDLAGNLSDTYTIALDTVIPVITSSQTSNSSTYNLTSDDVILEYSLDNGINWVSGDGTTSILITNLSDGEYTVLCKDDAKNVSSQFALLIDTIAPSVTSNLYSSGASGDEFNEDATHHFGSEVVSNDNYIVISDCDGESSCTGTIYVYDITKDEDEEGYAQTITSSHTTMFGYSMAISGDLLVVSDYKGTGHIGDAGVVYIYDLSTSLENPAYTLYNNNNAKANDAFGYSVAINGTRVVVGAPKEKTSAKSYSGAVYVYELSSLTNNYSQEELNAGSFVDNYNAYGYAVDINENYVVVGEKKGDGLTSNTGCVYVYHTGNLSLFSRIYASDGGDSSFFGSAVDIEENQLAVGAYQDDNQGAVYLYDLTKTNVEEGYETKIVGNNVDYGDDFGYTIQLFDHYLIVGTPNGDTREISDTGSVYIYDLSLDETDENYVSIFYSENPFVNYRFGYSLTMNSSGIYVSETVNDVVTEVIFTKCVEIVIADVNAYTITITLDDGLLDDYDELTFYEFGVYNVTVVDAANNETSISFTIDDL